MAWGARNLISTQVAASTAPHAALRQAGAWGLGVLADAGAVVPDAPRALVAALTQYPPV